MRIKFWSENLKGMDRPLVSLSLWNHESHRKLDQTDQKVVE